MYKQPRVPEMKDGGNDHLFIHRLVLFLKDFATAAWSANNRRKKEMEDLKKLLVQKGVIEDGERAE